MKILIIACALSVSLTVVQGSCPSGFTHWPQNGYCYKYFPTADSFNDADSACGHQAIGCKLASIHSSPEEGFVNELAQTTGDYWIGLNDIYEEDNWVWTDGTPTVWTNWECDHPNQGTAADCVAGNYGSSDRWRDASCEELNPYVCKVKAL